MYETVTPLGAPGVVMATVVSVDDHPEVPVLFTAATRKSYDCPPVSPVTVMDVAVEAVCANVDQVDPLVSL